MVGDTTATVPHIASHFLLVQGRMRVSLSLWHGGVDSILTLLNRQHLSKGNIHKRDLWER